MAIFPSAENQEAHRRRRLNEASVSREEAELACAYLNEADANGRKKEACV